MERNKIFRLYPAIIRMVFNTLDFIVSISQGLYNGEIDHRVKI
jgi:hypothetical protein